LSNTITTPVHPETTTATFAIEPCIWSLVMALLCLSLIYWHGPELSNDAYQYLSIANNIREHGQIATSIVYFDAERNSATVPAPETTAPPGYPFAITLLSLLGVEPITAGWITSLVSVTLVIPLLWWGAVLLGATTLMKRWALAIWLVNSNVVLYGSGVSSDAMFTCIVLAGVLLLVFGESKTDRATYIVPMGMFLLGLSYWVRYAGVFMVFGASCYSVWRLIWQREHRKLWICSVGVSFLVIACNVARNASVAGRIGVQRGGVLNPISSVLHNFVAVWYHLFLGNHRAHFDLPIALVFLCVLVMFALRMVVQRREIERGRATFLFKTPSMQILGAVVIVYCAGIVFAQTYTPLELGSRYFFPVLPIAILMLASFLQPLPIGVIGEIPITALILILVCSYATDNMKQLARTGTVFPHTVLTSYFGEVTSDGSTAMTWVQRSVPPDAVIVATEGQATAYLLKRTTICLASRQYTNQLWTEDSVYKLMRMYKASFLIVYPGLTQANDSDSVQVESEFIHGLLFQKYPCWLSIATRTPHVVVYQFHAGQEKTSGARPTQRNLTFARSELCDTSESQ
jgi:hypothetical protein